VSGGIVCSSFEERLENGICVFEVVVNDVHEICLVYKGTYNLA
jgi:hypothetical protein